MSDHDREEAKQDSKKLLKERLRKRMKEHAMQPRSEQVEDVVDTAPSFDLRDLSNDTAIVSMDEILQGRDLEDLESLIATEELEDAQETEPGLDS